MSYLNNVKDVFVDIIDGRQKILLLANAPHPDLGAIKNAIETIAVKIDLLTLRFIFIIKCQIIIGLLCVVYRKRNFSQCNFS